MLPVGFEPTISEGERPQTYALDRAATEIGSEHSGSIIYVAFRDYLKELISQFSGMGIGPIMVCS